MANSFSMQCKKHDIDTTGIVNFGGVATAIWLSDLAQRRSKYKKGHTMKKTSYKICFSLAKIVNSLAETQACHQEVEHTQLAC